MRQLAVGVEIGVRVRTRIERKRQVCLLKKLQQAEEVGGS